MLLRWRISRAGCSAIPSGTLLISVWASETLVRFGKAFKSGAIVSGLWLRSSNCSLDMAPSSCCPSGVNVSAQSVSLSSLRSLRRPTNEGMSSSAKAFSSSA
ncbi:hypothetical protein D3C81_1924440 [compost metagenome]